MLKYFYSLACMVAMCVNTAFAQEVLPPLAASEVTILSAQSNSLILLDWEPREADQKSLVLKSVSSLDAVSKVSIQGFDMFGNVILDLDRWWNAPMEAHEAYDLLLVSTQKSYSRLELSLFDEQQNLISNVVKSFPSTIYDQESLPSTYFTSVEPVVESDNLSFDYSVQSKNEEVETPLQLKAQIFKGERIEREVQEDMDLTLMEAGRLEGNLQIGALPVGRYTYELYLIIDDQPLSVRVGNFVSGDVFAQVNTLSEGSESLAFEGMASPGLSEVVVAYENLSGELFDRETLELDSMGNFSKEVDLKSLTEPLGRIVLSPGTAYEERVDVTRYEVVVEVNQILDRVQQELSDDPVYEFVDEVEPESKSIDLVLLFILLFLAIGGWFWRQRWKRLRMLCLGVLGVVGSVSAAVNPVVSWEHPATTEVLGFTGNAASDFRFMQLEGEVFNPLNYAGLFDTTLGIDKVSVQFSKGVVSRRFAIESLLSDASVYELGTNTYQSNYSFLIDLSLLNLTEGEWQVQLFFDTGAEIYGTPTVDHLGQPIGLINIDTTAPTVSFSLQDSTSAPIQPDQPLNTPIGLEITCDDGSGVGCLAGAGSVSSFPVVAVKGNFCGTPSECDHLGVRVYEVCDLVGNCSVQEIEIKNYDPIPPHLSDLEFGITDFFGSTLKANGDYKLSLDYVDPARVVINNSAVGVAGGTMTVPQAYHDSLFDPDACGDGSLFRNNGTQCEYTQKACVIPTDFTARGVLDATGACVPQCASNYTYDPTLSRCVADCNKTEFSPAFMCFDFDVH